MTQRNNQNQKTTWTETYNQATAIKYSKEIRALIRKYYKNVSDAAIDDFIYSGDFAELTAEQLLTQAGFYYKQIQPDVETIATNFVIGIEQKSNAEFRKMYVEAKKPIPNRLRRVSIDKTQENLISQQVNKIKNLCDYQYQKINEATQQAIVQKMNMTQYKKLLRDADLADEKKIQRIAANQLHFATNITNINKAQDLGITHGIWVHPKNPAIYKTHPRPSHVKADGMIFRLDKGCKIDGEYIYPSQLINCKCSWRIVV